MATSDDTSLLAGYNVFQFPQNIGDLRYPHFAIFYINVNDKSRAAKSISPDFVGADLSKNKVGESSSQVISNSTRNGGKKIKDLTNDKRFQEGIKNGVSRLGPMGETVSEGIISGTESFGSFVEESSKFTSGFKRLDKAIVLYMPHQINSTYGASYNEAGANPLGNQLIGALKDLNDPKTTTWDAIKNATSGGLESATRETGHLFGHAAFNGDVGGIIGAITGKVNNPRTEMVFDKIDIRSFRFTYIFSPQNRDESESIQEIIYLFKFHMHPEILESDSVGSRWLTIPDEFDIEFYSHGIENTAIPKITTCVLENMSVDYTPNGQWIAFDGEPFPPQIVLTLSFRELEPLHKGLIEKGY